jgi:undecaprenyl diphosphate synthase
MESSASAVPAHVGIIMDGNGRWAAARGLPRVEGHRRGAERSRDIILHAADLGVDVLTLYTFSMENWQRPPSEISVLMKILSYYLEKELDKLLKEGIRFRSIGEIWRLPKDIQQLIREAEQRSAENTRMTLVGALSYGGRNEILRAVKKLLSSSVAPDTITEKYFTGLLDTANMPPPDLIIRTSGEQRLSNFLLWQSAYAEFYFTDVLWPDFTKERFDEALQEYRLRERRFGSV